MTKETTELLIVECPAIVCVQCNGPGCSFCNYTGSLCFELMECPTCSEALHVIAGVCERCERCEPLLEEDQHDGQRR